MSKEIDIKRIDICNRIIEEISKHSRQFFSKGQFKAGFEVDKQLFYRDEIYGKRIPIKEDMKFNNNYFNHGSGLQGLIERMIIFIYTGEMQNIDSRYWGYDFDDLKTIHKLAKDLGFSKTASFTAVDYSTNKTMELIDGDC